MIADYHRQAIEANEGVRLVAVGYHDSSRFDEIGARFGVPCLRRDCLLANPNMDAVCISMPSGRHAEQASAAAKAGEHVLVEKLMALEVQAATDAGSGGNSRDIKPTGHINLLREFIGSIREGRKPEVDGP